MIIADNGCLSVWGLSDSGKKLVGSCKESFRTGGSKLFLPQFAICLQPRCKLCKLTRGEPGLNPFTEQIALQFCIFIAQMYAVTPQLKNQINKIRETEF